MYLCLYLCIYVSLCFYFCICIGRYRCMYHALCLGLYMYSDSMFILVNFVNTNCDYSNYKSKLSDKRFIWAPSFRGLSVHHSREGIVIAIEYGRKQLFRFWKTRNLRAWETRGWTVPFKISFLMTSFYQLGQYLNKALPREHVASDSKSESFRQGGFQI